MQSVLGLSAVDAGVTLAVQPVASMLATGFAVALLQKVHGKYLLIPGLIALAAGSAYIDWAAQVGSGRWDFVPGLIASGLGMAFIWTPVFSIGTRDLPAYLGGAASGIINTIQEMGGVLASAVVGAFLQNRLALSLHDRAVAASTQLPAPYRVPFIDAFSNAAHAGFEVGAGQSGTKLQLPGQVASIAHSVFTHAFVDAMHPTFVLPIAVLVLAAVMTGLVRTRARVELALDEREPAVA